MQYAIASVLLTGLGAFVLGNYQNKKEKYEQDNTIVIENYLRNHQNVFQPESHAKLLVIYNLLEIYSKTQINKSFWNSVGVLSSSVLGTSWYFTDNNYTLAAATVSLSLLVGFNVYNYIRFNSKDEPRKVILRMVEDLLNSRKIIRPVESLI